MSAHHEPAPSRWGVFDAHVDSLQRQLDLGHDLGTRTGGHLDLVRGKAGGLRAVVLVNWVDPKHLEAGPGAARARARALLEQFHALMAAHPAQVGWAGNGAQLDALWAAGRIAAIAGIEGAHVLEDGHDDLVWFFERGLRVLTLVWNNHLPWIRSCQDGAGAGVPKGLSAEGRSIVRTLNELGVLVDLSHAGERSFFDTLDCSSRPVIASHSGCKALHGHQRNLSDEQLRALADHGSVVGIVFCPAFLSEQAQREEQRLRSTRAFQELPGRNDTEITLRQGEYLQRHAAPLPLSVVADHVCHAVEVAGVEHVGLGSDYDGIGRTPQGLEDASCYGNLAAEMARRGLSERELELVMGANMRRVFAQATGPGTAAHSRKGIQAE